MDKPGNWKSIINENQTWDGHPYKVENTNMEKKPAIKTKLQSTY